jgi:hypothetical protein
LGKGKKPEELQLTHAVIPATMQSKPIFLSDGRMVDLQKARETGQQRGRAVRPGEFDLAARTHR